MRRYYPGITIFKLTGSLMVLLAHIMLIRYMEFMPHQQPMQFVFLNLRFIIPCFYVVAGFLAYKGWTYAANAGAYVQKYIYRILTIYCFFCLLFAAEYVLPALVSNGLTMSNLFLQTKIVFMTVFLNGPFIQFWFIPPLVFGILVSYWFYRKQKFRLAAVLALLGYTAIQFVSGSFRTVLSAAAGSLSFLDTAYFDYFNLFATRYIGFGFTFVIAGVLLAKHEEKLMQNKAWKLIIPTVILILVETLLLIRFTEWTTDYKLTFGILPCTILVFYGILSLKSQAIQSYHKVINLFSIVTFCAHIPFMKINLLLLGWNTASMNVSQDVIFLLLTFFECVAVTLFITYRKKVFAARQTRNLSS